VVSRDAPTCGARLCLSGELFLSTCEFRCKLSNSRGFCTVFLHGFRNPFVMFRDDLDLCAQSLFKFFSMAVDLTARRLQLCNLPFSYFNIRLLLLCNRRLLFLLVSKLPYKSCVLLFSAFSLAPHTSHLLHDLLELCISAL
jgi:hypothetical protein